MLTTETHEAVLLDIEGTTTPISFVYEQLFPYARHHLEEFLAEHAEDPDVRRELERLHRSSQREHAEHPEGTVPVVPGSEAPLEERVAAANDNLQWQMDLDRKSTALKAIQGMIWRKAYERGDIFGEVFEDVPAALRAWKERGLGVYIYSSGSVQAQKLLFEHSDAGDLTPWLDGHFDTTTGSKKEAQSYEAIAEEIGAEPGRILFATDSLVEARAADAAGLDVVLMDRPGNPEVDEEHDFELWEDFTDELEEDAASD
jgi:enolase-phosphatase E1